MFSGGLGSEWLTGVRLVLLLVLLLVGFHDNNAQPSSLALFCLGLSNILDFSSYVHVQLLNPKPGPVHPAPPLSIQANSEYLILRRLAG